MDADERLARAATPQHVAHEHRADLEERVHVDLLRVQPEDMVTTQEVRPAPDPQGGRDPETEFMLRNAGW